VGFANVKGGEKKRKLQVSTQLGGKSKEGKVGHLGERFVDMEDSRGTIRTRERGIGRGRVKGKDSR